MLGGAGGLLTGMKSGLASRLAVIVYNPGYLRGVALYIRAFLLVVSINILGLLPYVFTPTRHICFSFTLCFRC